MKLDELFNKILQEAPLPDSWNQSMFTGRNGTYAQMIAYAKERAAVLGKGSSRIAFEVPYQGRKTVLKVALSQGKGLAQNEEEANMLSDWYVKDSGIAIPLIDYDEKNNRPTWIHTEYAEKITQKQLERFFNGVSMVTIARYLNKQQGRQSFGPVTIPDALRENDLFHQLQDIIVNYNIPADDLSRKANWGLYKGKPVIIDLGFTDNTVKLYR